MVMVRGYANFEVSYQSSCLPLCPAGGFQECVIGITQVIPRYKYGINMTDRYETETDNCLPAI